MTMTPEGDYTYTPVQGYADNDTPDSFTYTVTDGELSSEPVTASITVTNAPPVSNDDTAGTNQNMPVVIDVLSNDEDPDGDEITPMLSTGDNAPHHGTIVLSENGSVIYTPYPDYHGEDSFRYFISDGQSDGQVISGLVHVTVYAAATIPAAPLPTTVQMDISGCPALINWAAKELGTNQASTQIWVTNTLASPRDIQPCSACANLREAAAVLKNRTFIDALTRVVDGIVPADAPVSEEQMASITTALAGDTEANSDLAYAKEYISTLQNYINIINVNLKLSRDDSITVAVDNYIAPLAEKNSNLAVYLTATLTTNTGR